MFTGEFRYCAFVDYAFLETARRLKVSPADCLVFEDSMLRVEAAAGAGMECVFVPRAGASSAQAEIVTLAMKGGPRSKDA